MTPHAEQKTSASPLKRRRAILLGSVFALAMTGMAAIQPSSIFSPASAQTALSAPNAAQPAGFADMVEAVKPAVVGVRVKTSEGGEQATETFNWDNLPPQFRRFFEDMPGFRPDRGEGRRGQRPDRRFGMSQGSGFFISADGYVVTNNHVVENAAEVEIVDDAGKTHAAEVVGTDSRTDLALLKVKSDGGGFPFVRLADTAPRIGDWVVAIGNPFGLGGTVTAGIVSAQGRDINSGPYDSFLQIDAAVNRGNSGGPTFNTAGEVVGVNTAIYSPSGGNVGIAFAVPAETVARVVQSLRETGTVTRGWLGVQIQPINDDLAKSLELENTNGALVSVVQPDSPAAKAGIRPRDAILAVNGKNMEGPRDLSRFIADLEPGSDATLLIWRDGREREVTVSLGTMPDQPQLAAVQPDPEKNELSRLNDLGLQVQPAASVPGSGDEGVVVTEVASDSPLADRLQAGDVITKAGSVDVASPSDLVRVLREAEDGNGRPVLCRVQSGDTVRYVAIPVKRG